MMSSAVGQVYTHQPFPMENQTVSPSMIFFQTHNNASNGVENCICGITGKRRRSICCPVEYSHYAIPSELPMGQKNPEERPRKLSVGNITELCGSLQTCNSPEYQTLYATPYSLDSQHQLYTIPQSPPVQSESYRSPSISSPTMVAHNPNRAYYQPQPQPQPQPQHTQDTNPSFSPPPIHKSTFNNPKFKSQHIKKSPSPSTRRKRTEGGSQLKIVNSAGQKSESTSPLSADSKKFKWTDVSQSLADKYTFDKLPPGSSFMTTIHVNKPNSHRTPPSAVLTGRWKCTKYTV